MSSTSSPHRWSALALILVIWLAWALYLYRLDAQSLWYDEGVTATIAQRPLVALTEWTARDIQPPLYYYAVAGWGRLAGWSEWSLRFLSAWWGVLTVGLMSAVAIRLSGMRLAGRLAALLTALHPLLLYYSQEARMYTMLVALGLLTAYLLLRARDTARPALWGAYLLAAAAAVYTHYFAFFLLAAFGVAYLLDLWVSGNDSRHAPAPTLTRRRLLPFLLATLGVLLLYGSWVATLLTQLGSDASYWQGPFKLWDALRTLGISFVVGESVLESAASPWLLIAGGALLVSLVASGVAASALPARRARFWLYTLPWLVVPVAGVLGLAAFVPKFNARYVMIALPALLLLWSNGLALLLAHQVQPAQRAPAATQKQLHPTSPQGKNLLPSLGRGKVVLPVVGLVCLTALLITFGQADRAWFTDPAFTKAQWRELSAYLHQERADDEVVILVSGHAWPIWDYYAPALPTLRLPDLEILDVNAVLDYAQSAAALEAGLQGYRGAWLVTWQDEVVDPTGVTALHLGLAGDEQGVDAQFWQLGVRHFVDLDATAITPTAPTDHLLQANFANQLTLYGYAQAANDDLLLFWQAHAVGATPLPDLHLNLRTTDGAGLLYADPADRRPAAYLYPVPRWRPGEVVVGRLPAVEWAGAAALPGAYQLHLGLYDPAGDPAGLDQLDNAGNALGKTVLLDLTLTAPTALRAEVLPAPPIELAPGLLAAMTTPPPAVEAGAPLALTLYWQRASALLTTTALSLTWQPVADGPEVTFPLTLPVALGQWPEQWLRQGLSLQAPSTLVPGDYQLIIHAPAGSSALAVPLAILPSTRRFALPVLALPLDVALFEPEQSQGAEIQLAGLVERPPSPLAPTQPLTLTLAWQAPEARSPQADYHFSVQLLGAAGPPLAQVDGALPLGSSTWLPGQVVTQTVTLPALATPVTTPGPYQLIVALYRPELTVRRLLTANGADHVVLLP